MSAPRSMRIFASVAHETDVDRYIALMKFIPNASFLFCGFYHSLGVRLVINGFEYIHAGLFDRCPTVELDDIPIGELRNRGMFESTAPLSVRKSLQCYMNKLELEVEKFRPDVVVIANIHLAGSYLLQRVSIERGIRVVSLHPSFIRNKYIVNSSGLYWEDNIRSAVLNQDCEKKCFNIATRNGGPFSLKHQKFRFFDKLVPFERLFRLILHANRYDSWKSLLSFLVSRICSLNWFSELQTLKNIEDVTSGFVLVAMNRPLIEGSSFNYADLIQFSIECTPEHLPIVIRPHPLEREPTRLHENILMQLTSRRVFVSRQSTGPHIDSLFEHCRAVITFNSAFGIEALLKNVYVFTLERAFYTREGCAEYVSMADAVYVKERLKSDPPPRPDIEMVSLFVNTLIKDHMVDDPTNDRNGAMDLAKRIVSIIGSAQKGN